ncbi:MAG: shikimate kinase [Ilumatobacter sp.]|uniref:shikimate kinase n=1 Tax=Ilumatobacter sp. TaxID=1967498 RepID=UPI00262DF11E|nr:shikimate kinase [Ilumatobacter sp.]MDJ0767602.1 shikimate kinase [Ilumatobacter sp.]
MDEDRRNVVLTGFMGTGKTTVGRLLADLLLYDFLDTDHVIEVRHGPIPEIFAEHGEGEFRRLERELCAELAQRDGLVISTGGRLMVDPVNAEVLAASSSVYCLTAPVDTILERVAADDELVERPLLAETDVRARVTELLAERAHAYERFEQIDTDGRSAEDVAADLAVRLRS